MVIIKAWLVVGVSQAIFIVAGCSSSPVSVPGDGAVSTADRKVELPIIPPEAFPESGAVEEYWANGQLKSERIYRDGKIIAAEFYASDGTLVHEMSAHTPRPESVSNAAR